MVSWAWASAVPLTLAIAIAWTLLLSNQRIGSALVEELHAQGLRVYATARSLGKMTHLAKLSNVTLVIFDVTNPDSIATAVTAVHQELSSRDDGGDTLDIIINNAGQSIVYPALDTSIEEAKRLFDVNFWGVVAVTQAFVPLLRDSRHGGAVVSVCSISGFLYAPGMSTYNASKAALMSWSETLRLELEPFNTRVISLVTGSVATNVMSHSNIALHETSLYHKAFPDIQARGVGEDVSRKSAPADFAREVVKVILGGASGTVWRGAMALMVRFMVKFMDRAIQTGIGLDKLR
ncbi:NAD(P)-binding protein [Aspergillus pseudoustus]|uniref:NAD(P)-binding protein n=1 Tax=Aspergillus pseudoustus TaxID=1810923 RepID=A0ABR4JV71_9EURO